MMSRLRWFTPRLSDQIWRFVHSVRFRLTLWSLVIVAIILYAFSAFVYIQQKRDSLTIAMERASTQVDQLGKH